MGAEMLQIIIAIIGIIPGTFQAINEFFSRWEARNRTPTEPAKFKLIELTREPYKSDVVRRVGNQQIISAYVGLMVALIYIFMGNYYWNKESLRTEEIIDKIELQTSQELSRLIARSASLKDSVISNQIARIEKQEKKKIEKLMQNNNQTRLASFIVFGTGIFVAFIAGFNNRIGSNLKQSFINNESMMLGDRVLIKFQSTIKDREEAYYYVLDRCCKSLDYINFKITQLNLSSGEIEARHRKNIFYFVEFYHPKNRITIQVKKLGNFCFSILVETHDSEIYQYENRNHKLRFRILSNFLKGTLSWNTIDDKLYKNSSRINRFIHDFIS